MDRNQISEEVLELSRRNDRLVLSWGTGVGKSKVAIDIMNDILDSRPESRILLLVNETAHKKNWKEQFEEWHLKKCDLTMECYASLKKYESTSWDIVVADEAHHLESEKRLAVLRTMKVKHFICLSATMSKDMMFSLERMFGKFVHHNVTLKDAIRSSILPEPVIKIVKMNLDSFRRTEEIVEAWGPSVKRAVVWCDYRDRMRHLNRQRNPALELHIRCTQKEKYDWFTEQFDYWERRYKMGRLQFAKNKWLHCGSDRKRFLGECKTDAAKRIIASKGKDSRYICFCTSIDQCNSLGGKNAIHSKVDNPQKLIDDFNEGNSDSLYAVGMLQEGMNLKDIDWGMIVQLDGKERGWIQKSGRMMRGEHPEIIILCYDGTRDMDYLRNVLEGMDKSYIKFYRL